MSRFLMRMFPVLLLLALVLALSEGARPVAARGSGSVSGRLIQDTDGDGDMGDVSEPGLAGWHVRLEMDTGTRVIVHETVTNNDGRYSFSRLAPGDYNVSIPCDGQPSSWLVTAPDTGGVWSATVEADEDSGGIDFWLSLLSPTPPRNGRIVGRVVWDENRDSVPDPSEPGAAGWAVAVWLDGAVCFEPDRPETYSASDGSFGFAGLVPGPYMIDVVGPAAPGPVGYIFDSPGTTRKLEEYDLFELSDRVVVPAGGSVSIGVGIVSIEGSGSISGVLYYDLNANGVRDPDEPLMPGSRWVGLSFRTAKGYTAVNPGCCMSQPDGRFEFSGLAAGDYMVGVVDLSVDAINPPAGPNRIPELPVVLADGERRTGVDFGFALRPGDPTPQTVPTAEPPTPIAPTPMALTPTPVSTPVPELRLSLPVTGSHDASSGGDLAGLAAALAVVGALAVGASVLVGRRWRARFRR
jgi:hypothetical protein